MTIRIQIQRGIYDQPAELAVLDSIYIYYIHACLSSCPFVLQRIAHTVSLVWYALSHSTQRACILLPNQLQTHPIIVSLEIS